MFVGVADDQTDAGQGCNLFGCTLGVASRNNDLRFRIVPAEPADRGARILIGARGNGAGIQHHDGGLRGSRGA